MKLQIISGNARISLKKLETSFPAKSRKVDMTGSWLLFLLLPLIFIPMRGNSTPVVKEDIMLSEALHRLSQKYEVFFSYDEKMVEEVEVSYEPEQYRDIEHALEELLTGTSLRYKIFDNRYIILYEESQEAITSLKGMVRHLESVIDSQEEISRSRKSNRPVPMLDRLVRMNIEPLAFNVSGTVTDQEGEPLIGVNIQVKGTNTGTATDFEGRFTLEDIDENAVLVVSYIGYQTQEVAVAGKSNLSITLASDSQLLDEVVVVGYGTQKKVNLTGAVSTVGEKELNRRIVTRTSQLLQGAISGLTVIQGSGEPGRNGASLNIRGLGTFSSAGNSPLVLIDGVPSSINSVNPSNIESISVLKDAASAAIYGSRAANGVILITTKEGKSGVMQIIYESYIGKQQATQLPQYVDSWTYAQMLNEARENGGLNRVYTPEDIEKYKSGQDTDNYPNKHHLRDLFNSGNGLQTKHNLTFNGGTEETVYLFSVGYLRQNGLIVDNNYDRYDLQLNVNSQLKKNLALNVKLSGYESISESPAGITDPGARTRDLAGVITAANHYNATIPGKRSDGSYGIAQGHPVAEGHLNSGSFENTRNTYLNANIELVWDIANHLKFSNRVNYQLGYGANRLFGAEFEAAPGWVFGPSQVNTSNSNSRGLIYESLLNYDKTFGDHNIELLGGFSSETHGNESLGGFRDNFPSNQLHILSAASPENDDNSESASTWKLVSYFSRLNYSYQGKYLLEGNLRYDGSSRFTKDSRYGLFPSFSAGWRMSEEDFFNVSWIDNFKIRASYGELGNQQIGLYPYQKTLTLGSVYPTGIQETINSAVQLTRLPFERITWETTKVKNGGVDITLFNGEINFTADYYQKITDGILYQLTVSQVLGMSVGEQNAGKVENKGWEFELGYQKTMGDFSFSINPNFSANQNKVLSLAGVEKDISKGLFIGESLQSIYGYETDGLFVDQADIENYAEQNYQVKPGFPRFVDISGPDGVPDGKVTSAYDRKIIGNQFPKLTYGAALTAEYRGFDFFAQVQGLGDYETLIQGDEQAFNNFGNIQQWHIDNRWTEANPDRNAKYPRLELASHAAPWDVPLDYWTKNGTFLRLKNVQIGYTIPSNYLERVFIDELRLYLHGENLFSIDNYYPGWDPEMVTNGNQAISYYPIAKTWSLGLNIKF